MKLKHTNQRVIRHDEVPRELRPFAWVNGRFLFPSFGHIALAVKSVTHGHGIHRLRVLRSRG